MPTSSLVDMMTYIDTYLEQNTTLRLTPASVGELHEMVTFYIVTIKGKLLVVLDIPLSSYPGPFEVFVVHVHTIRVQNSAFDSVLELEHRYVAIHSESGAYLLLSAEDINNVRSSRRHLMRYPVVRKDANRSCVMSIF